MHLSFSDQFPPKRKVLPAHNQGRQLQSMGGKVPLWKCGSQTHHTWY